MGRENGIRKRDKCHLELLNTKKTSLPHINSRHLEVKMVTYSSFT